MFVIIWSPTDGVKLAIINDFYLSIVVDNLPVTSQIYNGVRSMTLSLKTGDGVYVRSGEYLFLFTCDESSCKWTTVKGGLSYAMYGAMMPLPSDYTCE